MYYLVYSLYMSLILFASTVMITDYEPILSKFISIPNELSNFSTESFTAGIIESVLDGLNYNCKVTAHNVPVSKLPKRTTYLIKLL